MDSRSHVARFVYHQGFLSYDFGPQHPLRPERITAGLDLMQAAGLLSPETDILEPAPATREELELIHDPAYIRAVEEASSGWFPGGELAQYGLAQADNPAFPGMHEASALVAGGSAEAIRCIMRGEVDHAFNAAGGLHHAQRARASGFCVYDDPALAAAIAVREFDARVLYLDFDCHHGDGVQWLFYAEPRVMTVSFHESGRYLFPGTGDVTETGTAEGKGYALNLPLQPFTRDESWSECLHALVPEVVERFRPDVIISSHGADTHVWDPLTHLALTTGSFVEQAQLVHLLAHEIASGRWLAVGSGGYDWRRVVPRSWSIVWSEMTQRALPEALPLEWVRHWDSGPDEPMPAAFLDEADVSVPTPRESEIARQNRLNLESVRQTLRSGPLSTG